jgi:hypothetical protein
MLNETVSKFDFQYCHPAVIVKVTLSQQKPFSMSLKYIVLRCAYGSGCFFFSCQYQGSFGGIAGSALVIEVAKKTQARTCSLEGCSATLSHSNDLSISRTQQVGNSDMSLYSEYFACRYCNH